MPLVLEMKAVPVVVGKELAYVMENFCEIAFCKIAIFVVARENKVRRFF